MELREIFLRHCRTYPELAPADLIKLAYQNEFGCRHLLQDAPKGLVRLAEEWARADTSPGAACDEIGNGLCRLNLAAAKRDGLTLLTAGRFFIDTAQTHTGTAAGLAAKLDVLASLCADGALPFDGEALRQALARYKEDGCPALGHSERYRTRYRPAYRVVKRAYCAFLPLFCRIDLLLGEKPNPVIAIDGNAAAGKSTLADLIAGVYDCHVVRMDHFFLPREKRTAARLSEVGGNVDYERFYDQVVRPMSRGAAFSYPIFDCRRMAFGGRVKVNPLNMTVVEGSYSLHPHFGAPYDLKVFLSAAPETQKFRILKRNGPEMLAPFFTRWIPMEHEYFRKLRIPETCDLIFESGDA